MINVQSFGDKHPGRRRKNNEDFVVWFEPSDPAEIEASGCLYILADGVGGAARGERASQYAAQKVLYEYYQHPEVEPGERLRRLMLQANDDIFTHAEQNGNFKRMATTMVAVVVRKGALIIANVGDSRAYLIRDRMATQLTRDHSIVGEMVANGDMTEEEAQASKIKNRLTRSIGGDADVHVDIYKPHMLQPGDKILLCSDGLTRYATREDITNLTIEGSPKEIVDSLIMFANQRGGADNISAILIAFGATEKLEPTVRIQRRPLPPNIEDTLDTIPDFKPNRKPLTLPIFWATLAVVGLIIFGAIAVSGLQAFTQKTSTASTPPVIALIAPTPSLSPTTNTSISNSPSATPSLDALNPTSTPTIQTQFKILCPDGVNVRIAASIDASPAEITLSQGDFVTITGKAAEGKITENGDTGIWLEIIYPQDLNQTRWVAQKPNALCIDVNAEQLILITVTPYLPTVDIKEVQE